jgi:hypothetical protein
LGLLAPKNGGNIGLVDFKLQKWVFWQVIPVDLPQGEHQKPRHPGFKAVR